MSRPIRLQGETDEKLLSLKETCEMEGSRMVSLRADELLGLVNEITVSPGAEVQTVDMLDVDTAVLQAEVDRVAKLDAMLAAAAEEKHDLVEANVQLKLQLDRRDKELLDQLALFGEEQKKSIDLAAKLNAAASERDINANALKEESAKWQKLYDEQTGALKAKVSELETKLAPFQAALAAAATPKPADPPASNPPAP